MIERAEVMLPGASILQQLMLDLKPNSSIQEQHNDYDPECFDEHIAEGSRSMSGIASIKHADES